MKRGVAALAVLTLSIATAAVAVSPPIRGMAWVSRDADPIRALATAPTECLSRPVDPDAALGIEIGRAAFRTPVLLGGQAARAGIACESCHRQGRGNPDFQFPGVSGAPGTADVTSALFSSHRGNGLVDPQPIPDLSGPNAALRIDQSPGRTTGLEPFLLGLIVEEFDGPAPSSAVLAGLAAYVRALDPAACPAASRQPLALALFMDDARRALRAARLSAANGDPATAVLMVAAARARLGLIDERFAADPALARDRASLRAADARLARAQAALRYGRADAQVQLRAWLQDAPALEAALTRRESASLFNPVHLVGAAKRRLPG